MKTLGKFGLMMAALVVLASAAFAEATPAGSFSPEGVTSVAELSAQMQNPNVVANYEAVYGKSASEIQNAVKDFKLTTLKSALEAPVYYIDKSGKIGSSTQVLSEGTLVFADKNDNPAMLYWSGNPIGTSNVLLPADGAAAAGATGTAAGAGAAGSSWIAPAIGAVGAIAIISSSDDDDVVPEPASFIAIATGLAALPIIKKRIK
ncbi:MAG: hypothetical protein J6U98_02240 [Abditibacteriota bacterium]|nr:hypothetical protein [Abditibacteriota bacterium]MBP5717693.1 hypothetical protein [Abditibacteriota bacterium]MBP5737819.1 hypothetical protein [Abditibacteriota bacterium]